MSTILGICGGPNVLGIRPLFPGLQKVFFHDAAAALVTNGRILAAVEEERTSRIKHTNYFPVGAIRSCLQSAYVSPDAIDAVAYFYEEDFCNVDLRLVASELRIREIPNIRAIISSNLNLALGIDYPSEKINFVRHHDAHCAAAVAASGFSSCLAIVMDGNGEAESTSVYLVNGDEQTLLKVYLRENSLGHFFRQVTSLLGFGEFDEYKVMGLASYGNPERYRKVFASIYMPGESGDFKLETHLLARLAWEKEISARGPLCLITKNHKDFAASAQELLERIVLDIVRFWRDRTNERSFCLTGGVAQNCVMNSSIAQARLFDSMYVYPASHDAGTALGAALLIERRLGNHSTSFNKFSPYIGRLISNEESADVSEALDQWNEFLQWEKPPSIPSRVASAIADGKIIGWARGRAEFGPRALGSRSIIADPRRLESRQRIGNTIKQRENFRPFAPAVNEEFVDEYFILPEISCNLGEMCFVAKVKERWKSKLAAITHIDGTARLQVVSSRVNPDFWGVIQAFKALTGIGMLLNTSFNNHCEPIIDSPIDAVRTFLISGLDGIVLGPYFVTKIADPLIAVRDATIVLCAGLTNVNSTDEFESKTIIARGLNSVKVSRETSEWLQWGKELSVRDGLGKIKSTSEREFLNDVYLLWESGAIDLLPKRPL